jgi:hypothetical protein
LAVENDPEPPAVEEDEVHGADAAVVRDRAERLLADSPQDLLVRFRDAVDAIESDAETTREVELMPVPRVDHHRRGSDGPEMGLGNSTRLNAGRHVEVGLALVDVESGLPIVQLEDQGVSWTHLDFDEIGVRLRPRDRGQKLAGGVVVLRVAGLLEEDLKLRPRARVRRVPEICSGGGAEDLRRISPPSRISSRGIALVMETDQSTETNRGEAITKGAIGADLDRNDSVGGLPSSCMRNTDGDDSG